MYRRFVVCPELDFVYDVGTLGKEMTRGLVYSPQSRRHRPFLVLVGASHLDEPATSSTRKVLHQVSGSLCVAATQVRQHEHRELVSSHLINLPSNDHVANDVREP